MKVLTYVCGTIMFTGISCVLAFIFLALGLDNNMDWQARGIGWSMLPVIICGYILGIANVCKEVLNGNG